LKQDNQETKKVGITFEKNIVHIIGQKLNWTFLKKLSNDYRVNEFVFIEILETGKFNTKKN